MSRAVARGYGVNGWGCCTRQKWGTNNPKGVGAQLARAEEAVA